MTLKTRRVARAGKVVLEDARLDVYLDGVEGAQHQRWRSVSVEGGKASILAFLRSRAARAFTSALGDHHGLVVGGYPSFINCT